MPDLNFIATTDLKKYIVSIKDIWTLDLEDKYIDNPSLINLSGFRIVIWNFSCENIDKISHKQYTARHNPFSDNLQILKVKNHSSYLMQFSKEEFKKRSKTIQLNSKMDLSDRPVIYNYTALREDLFSVNKEELKEFSYHYKIQMGEKLQYKQFKIDKVYDEEEIILSLVVTIPEEDGSIIFEKFSNSIKVNENTEEFYKYFNFAPQIVYSTIASYVDGIEIFTFKDIKKFNLISQLIYEWEDKIKDPMIDNTKFISKLIDCGIDPKFLANFIPNKSCLEFQLIGIDKRSYNILGPIYVTRNIY